MFAGGRDLPEGRQTPQDAPGSRGNEKIISSVGRMLGPLECFDTNNLMVKGSKIIVYAIKTKKLSAFEMRGSVTKDRAYTSCTLCPAQYAKMAHLERTYTSKISKESVQSQAKVGRQILRG